MKKSQLYIAKLCNASRDVTKMESPIQRIVMRIILRCILECSHPWRSSIINWVNLNIWHNCETIWSLCLRLFLVLLYVLFLFEILLSWKVLENWRWENSMQYFSAIWFIAFWRVECQGKVLTECLIYTVWKYSPLR